MRSQHIALPVVLRSQPERPPLQAQKYCLCRTPTTPRPWASNHSLNHHVSRSLSPRLLASAKRLSSPFGPHLPSLYQPITQSPPTTTKGRLRKHSLDRWTHAASAFSSSAHHERESCSCIRSVRACCWMVYYVGWRRRGGGGCVG